MSSRNVLAVLGIILCSVGITVHSCNEVKEEKMFPNTCHMKIISGMQYYKKDNICFAISPPTKCSETAVVELPCNLLLVDRVHEIK